MPLLHRRLSSLNSSFKEETTTTIPPSAEEVVLLQPPIFPIYYNDVYEVSLPPHHRFPMAKYGKVRRILQNRIRDTPLLDQNHCQTGFHVSPLATVEELATTHDREYIRRYMNGEMSETESRNVGFPWSMQGVKRTLSSVGGTVAAAMDVCRAWMSVDKTTKVLAPWGAHTAGGTHHAFRDYGEGFCVFSDIAVAANVVRQRFPSIQSILILDLDVHQGNGNAVLFQNRTDVFTFSMHCNANYFSEKQQSDLDIELPPNCNDSTYLLTLSHWLKELKKERWDMIFFQAGVDILADDRLGRMSISQEGLRRRNRMVYDFADELNIPFIISMGGGYPRTNDWSPILEAHADVYFQAFLYRVGQYRKLVKG